MRPNQVAILGAGPIGLDAALACLAAGWPCTVHEAGSGSRPTSAPGATCGCSRPGS
jgi:2-polyprenyl-6-methoxyphenol hydroxylase-like FAD-dependent oxidoreductase